VTGPRGPDLGLKAPSRRADAIAVTAQLEPTGSDWYPGGQRWCPDCGQPIEADLVPHKSVVLCRACYDVYVDNAGR
jgi:hypothetical protein